MAPSIRLTPRLRFSRQIADVPAPGALYSTLMDLIVRFARAGLIHGDFNEFNILIRRDSGEPVVIDFPQMVSTSHKDAEWYVHRGSMGSPHRAPLPRSGVVHPLA